MPIAQNRSITEHDRALDYFTGRFAERRRFAEYLHLDPPPEKVLFFHGDGGNGKSLLLKLLRSQYCRRLFADTWNPLASLKDDSAFIDRFEITLDQAKDQAAVVPCIYHDFDRENAAESSPRESWSALLTLRGELAAHDIKLPTFDFAVIRYLQAGRQLSAARIKALFPSQEADFISSLVDAIATDPGQVPVAGTVFKVLGLFDKHLGTRIAVWRAKKLVDDVTLGAIYKMDPKTELLDQLPHFFGKDLNTAMEERDTEAKRLRQPPARLALMFDTHEAFWGNDRSLQSTHSFFLRDEWLRRLISELYKPNAGVIVVVAGRERPRWHEAPEYSIPSDIMATHFIGHLSRKDAEQYLNKVFAPLTQKGKTVQLPLSQLIDYSEVEPNQVHPLFLGLIADLVFTADATNEPITAEEFAETPDYELKGRKLVNRLLRYCPLEVEHSVKALAAARGFDSSLFFELGPRLQFNATAAAFDSLIRFSFIWRDPTREHPWYRVHSLLSRILADLDVDATAKAHAALESVYRAREDDTQGSVVEAIYHANKQDWMRGADEWVDAMTRGLSQARYTFCEALADLRPALHLENDFVNARCTQEVGNLALVLSRWELAAASFENAIVTYDLYSGETFDMAAENNKGLAHQKLGELRAIQSRYAQAEASYTQAIAVYAEALARAPDDIDLLNNNGSALQRLSDLQAIQSRHALAEETCKRAIAAYTTALERAPNYIHAHNNKGNALLSLGELQAVQSRYALAEESYTHAIATFDSALELSPDDTDLHNNKGNTLGRLSDLLFTQSKYPLAKESCARAIATFDSALKRSPDDIDLRVNKGNSLLSLGDLQAVQREHELAEDSYTRSIAAYDTVLQRVPYDVRALSNKSSALYKVGELHLLQEHLALAEESYTRAIAVCATALEHAPDEIDVQINKGSAHMSLGALQALQSRHALAEASYTHAIAAFDSALERAPDHIQGHNGKGNTLQRLGNLQRAQGKYVLARESYSCAIAAFDSALQRAPDGTTVLASKAQTLRKFAELEDQRGESSEACRRIQEALELMRRALALAPASHSLADEQALITARAHQFCPSA